MPRSSGVLAGASRSLFQCQVDVLESALRQTGQAVAIGEGT
jgi:hypothetical protein